MANARMAVTDVADRCSVTVRSAAGGKQRTVLARQNQAVFVAHRAGGDRPDEVDDHRRGESDQETGCGDYDGMLCRSRPHLVFWAVRLCRSARYSTTTLQANFDALEPGESITLESGTSHIAASSKSVCRAFGSTETLRG